MKSLVIGAGEVGTSLYKILIENYPETEIYDTEFTVEPDLGSQFDILHICFPYSIKFIDYVKAYQEKYKPKYTVIHSTVPVGTSKALGAIHSPIRGLHPNLESGIRTFAKFIGGESVSEVADYFRRAGIKVTLFDKSETTEAMKLFDTEYYRTCIEFTHRVKKYCDEHNLNFHEVFTLANQTYNEGYTKLDHPEFVRPVLQPIMKEIGGHCLLPNKELIRMSEEKPGIIIISSVARLLVTIKDYEHLSKQGMRMEAYYTDKDGKQRLINEHLKNE